MKNYIPKQPKVTRERIEVKLDAPLVHDLEQYCTYLDSDRDYVIGQALKIAFKKDQGFCDWLAVQTTTDLPKSPDSLEAPVRVRKTRRSNLNVSAATESLAPELLKSERHS